MMQRDTWTWRHNGKRLHLLCRVYRHFSWHGLWRWLTAPKGYSDEGASIELRSRGHSNGLCYCPEGTLTDLRVECFGFILWLSYSRDWVQSPCLCDRVVWSVLPESYAEEIAEYGEDKLRAEFPDLWKETHYATVATAS